MAVTPSPDLTWSPLASTFRLEMVIRRSKPGFTGTIANEGGAAEPLSNISWNPNTRWLQFRRNGPGFFQWYKATLTYGVVAGRFSHSAAPPKPPLIAYAYHVTGWGPEWLDHGIVPRTWTLTIN